MSFSGERVHRFHHMSKVLVNQKRLKSLLGDQSKNVVLKSEFSCLCVSGARLFN